jgi:hypothetical protein
MHDRTQGNHLHKASLTLVASLQDMTISTAMLHDQEKYPSHKQTGALKVQPSPESLTVHKPIDVLIQRNKPLTPYTRSSLAA